jgi:CheY-like chemotaxis protein
MSKRILVVEDQADNRQIIRDMLAPLTTKSPKPKTVRRRLLLLRSSGPILS